MPPAPFIDSTHGDAARRLIPGAYERNTLTHRQAGSMAGAPYGSADGPAGPPPMSAATILERQKEGGGGESQRRPRVVGAR